MKKQYQAVLFAKSLFMNGSRHLHKALKLKSPSTLSEVIHISNKLAKMNWQRNQDWKTLFTTENDYLAVLVFCKKTGENFIEN